MSLPAAPTARRGSIRTPVALRWIAVAALAAAGFWLATFVLDRRSRRARLRSLREQWGAERRRDRDMTAIAAYARGLAKPGGLLDDRTWADLNMDEVFAALDRTESVVGQQVLYARMRSSIHDEHLDAFEALVTHIGENAAARERAQIALGRLRHPATTCGG
jgi:hypothetical protein